MNLHPTVSQSLRKSRAKGTISFGMEASASSDRARARAGHRTMPGRNFRQDRKRNPRTKDPTCDVHRNDYCVRSARCTVAFVRAPSFARGRSVYTRWILTCDIHVHGGLTFSARLSCNSRAAALGIGRAVTTEHSYVSRLTNVKKTSRTLGEQGVTPRRREGERFRGIRLEGRGRDAKSDVSGYRLARGSRIMLNWQIRDFDLEIKSSFYPRIH